MARIPPIPRTVSILAMLAAVGALVWLLLAGGPASEPVSELSAEALRPGARTGGGFLDRPRAGGVYAGVVLDVEGEPLHGAHVMLVAYGTGGTPTRAGGEPEIARVGGYSVGGETRTDEDGRFRIAADSQSYITRVLAYHTGYFVDVVEVSRPREDLKLTLKRGGRVLGTVVDDENGQPVAGARVDIYLQQKVSKVPDVPEGAKYPVIRRKQHEMSWLVTLGRFIPEVLGPRMYGLADSGSDTLRLRTDSNGHFEIGPLGDSVQLEFVITHPDYKWIDFDTDEGKKTPARTVVHAGETVQREFRMRKGEFVAGRVVDDTGQGVPNVLVKVQSISAYYRHWWYKHKYRVAQTDGDGRFRVDGLAIGTQQLALFHPSFGSKYESAEAGTDNLVIVADRLGALHGTLEGIPRGPPGRKVLVVLESLDENPRGGRQKRETTRLDGANQFLVERLLPGRYRAWVKAGREGSQPVNVEIEPFSAAKATFEMGGGGSIVARVIDSDGVLLDPANARLIEVRDGAERTLGTFVTREGELVIDGVVPGRYRLRVQAPGRIGETTDTFEVREERSTPLPAIVLREWGFLKFGQPVDESGRPARLSADLILEYRHGEGAFQRVYQAGVNVPVRPGTVEVRARSGDLRYEGRVEVEEGGETPVPVVLALPR